MLNTKHKPYPYADNLVHPAAEYAAVEYSGCMKHTIQYSAQYMMFTCEYADRLCEPLVCCHYANISPLVHPGVGHPPTG